MIAHGPAGFAVSFTVAETGLAVIFADAPNRFTFIPDIDSVPRLERASSRMTRRPTPARVRPMPRWAFVN